jgi:transposase
MGNPRGIKRDFQALERRRFEALKLLKKGYNQSEVGRRTKVCSQTVSRWARMVAEEGDRALQAVGRAGRKPLLEERQRKQLVARLLEGPEKLGYETPLWTCDRVGHLIEQEFGVRYHSGHVWKILRQLNWSPQRPVGRALERNEQAITRGRSKPGRQLKKSPKRRPHDRLHRRKRAKPAAAPLPHLGPARTDSGAAVSLQLEDHFRDRGHDAMELLLPTF